MHAQVAMAQFANPVQHVGCLSRSVSVSVSVQDGIVALGKAHTCPALSLSSLPKVALETVPIFVWLNTDRSQSWRVECRPLPFSTPLSSRQSMLRCFGLSMFRKFLKPLSTSALPSCRPDVISAVLASLSGLFILTDSGVPRTVDPQRFLKLKTVHGWQCASQGSPFQTPPFTGGSALWIMFNMSWVTWSKGTAPLLILTELKKHLLLAIIWMAYNHLLKETGVSGQNPLMIAPENATF